MPLSKTTTTESDAAFTKQSDAVREALDNFKAISFLNAPGPTKLAMEDLVRITVRSRRLQPISSTDHGLL
jgi:hypothetical protein